MTYETIHDLPPELKARWEKWSDGLCTSRCGNDIDCPHEEEFLAMLDEELLTAKQITQHND